MTGSLTATVVDALANKPASGLRLQVYWVEPQSEVLLRAASTDANGTTEKPLVSGPKLSAGVYKLVLHAGDYFQQTHPTVARCLDILPVVFVVDDISVGRQVTVSLAPDRYAVTCI